MYDFFLNERGITAETLEAFGVSVSGDSAAFPYPHGTKHRKHDGEKRQFWSEPKGELGLFGLRSVNGESVMFLVEGETDTMRLWQEIDDKSIGVVGLPGIEAWKEGYTKHFAAAETVYVILDNDTDYKVQSRVDNCWRNIRKSLGKKATRIYLPDGINDVCEFFNTYDLETLRMLAERKEEGLWHYKALDLTKEPSPPDWLVHELIAHKDRTMMIGEPGVGKSWLSMGLAVAVAQRWETFLGRKLRADNARVLYVDEENPEALVHWRLNRLGLTKVGVSNIRYLSQQGIRLDKYPDRILDEALDWEPTLIVLDSLTRLHTKEENNAGEISAIFNDGINPLARETGATLLILHHVNKTDSSSSFTRARGSSDITASPDTGLDVRKLDNGIAIHQYKSRWIAEGNSIRARIEDTPDGKVVIAVNQQKVVF